MISGVFRNSYLELFLTFSPITLLILGLKYAHVEKLQKKNFFKTRLVTYQNFCHDPRNKVLMFFEVLHT